MQRTVSLSADRTPTTTGTIPRAVEWVGDAGGALRLLDQTLLPGEVRLIDCRTAEAVWEAIRSLRVRGAPAIGVAAAYGVCLGTHPARGLSVEALRRKAAETVEYLCSARPTAVNLAWAARRTAAAGGGEALRAEKADPSRGRAMEGESSGDSSETIWAAMLREAHAIAAEDAAMCRRIGEIGADLIPDGGGVLTHCNAGALATAGLGTALAALYVAHERGKRFRVYADETRPLLQGARLTMYELTSAGLDATLLCDNAAAALMAAGKIDVVIVGADRIAANGDTANKIGTYGVAILAAHHGIPFYVAAPSSTFDLSLADGGMIPIEHRDADEVRLVQGRAVSGRTVSCWNPAFDVTPARLIRGIVTEKGLSEPVTIERIAEILG